MPGPVSSVTPVPAAAGSSPRVESRPSTPETSPATSVSGDVVRQDIAASGNPAPVEAVQQQTTEEVVRAAQDISDYIQTVSRSLQISVDGDLGSTVITVMDADTDEVVRQIPGEEVLQIARFIAEQQASSDLSAAAVKGLLMDSES